MNEKILHVFDHSIPLHSGYTFRSRGIVLAQRDLGWRTAHLTSAKHAVSARGGSGLLQETVDDLVFHRTFPGALSRVPLLRQWEVVRTLARRIVEVARAENVDLLHAHSPCLNGLAALWASGSLKIPIVYEVRAFWEDAAVDYGTASEGGPRYLLTRALETYVLRRVDQITCICEGLRKDIVARGVDPDRVTIVPNAVDMDSFPPLGDRDQALEAEFDLKGRHVIGFIGSFYAYEGLDLLLDAMPEILRHRAGTRVLLVGGGPQEHALRAQAVRLGISECVIFTGRVPHGRVPAYSSLIDAFVFPRKSMRLTDLVTPLKPLEAMAQRRLVLASDVGGHRELIEHGRTGFLFEHDDVAALARCVLQALRPSPSRSDVLDAARAYVERERNWLVSAQRYVKVYENACGPERETGVAGEFDSVR